MSLSGDTDMFHPFARTDIRVSAAEDASALLRKLTEDVQNTVVIASVGTMRRLDLTNKLPVSCRYFTAFSSNPTVDDLLNGLRMLDEHSAARLLSIGGGSAIDIGKALCAIVGMGAAGPRDYDGLCRAIGQREYLNYPKTMQHIAVPTTAGTGADVTQWGTIWDMRGRKKLSVDRPDLSPEMSLIVPAFTCGMDRRLTLSTGLDALAQAMESFWAAVRNPVSQALSLEALRYIRRYLPKVLEEPENVSCRQGMCLGALLSGLAFSKTRTTACHSISYPMTMLFGVPHGFAVAVTLEAVAERNESAVPEIAELYEVFGGKGAFHHWLETVSSDIMRLKLSAMGISEKDIPVLAKESFTQGRMDNNPVLFSPKDVEEILRQVL